MPETPPDEPVRETLAHMWIAAIKRGQYQKSYRIPDRVTWLPCGCSREGGYEADVNNQWVAIRSMQNLVHRECGRVIDTQTD